MAGPFTASPPSPDPTPAELSAIESNAAAAESQRKATPVIVDQPYEFPLVIITSQSTGKGIGLLTTDDGDLVTFEVHASPWPDKATLKAKIAAAVAGHSTNKATRATKRQAASYKIKAINGNSAEKQALQAILERLDAIEGVRP
jgi:hypothetical protein